MRKGSALELLVQFGYNSHQFLACPRRESDDEDFEAVAGHGNVGPHIGSGIVARVERAIVQIQVTTGAGQEGAIAAQGILRGTGP